MDPTEISRVLNAGVELAVNNPLISFPVLATGLYGALRIKNEILRRQINHSFYPYKPGKKGYGFPFQEIMPQPPFSEVRGEKKLDYGPSIQYTFTPSNIALIDLSDQYYQLVGNVDDYGVARFNLKTVKRLGPISLRSKTFFAADFVRLFLDYSRRNGKMVTVCKATWHPLDSDNFRQYKQARKRGKSKLEAAKSTWTGKQYAKLGFGKVYEDRIIDEENYVLVFFHKSSP